MSLLRIRPLVSASWLQHALTQHTAANKVKVFDATWTITANGREHFLREHIPTSQFFDLNRCVRSCQYRPRELPDEHDFTEYMESLGVRPDSHLVFYDSANMVPASRAWMTMRAYGHDRVSVLNGGLNQWQREGHDLSVGEPAKPEEGQFRVMVRRSLIRHFEDMIEASETGREQIIDVRNPSHFLGEADEPSPSTAVTLKTMKYQLPPRMSKGHMPNSVNLLIGQLMDSETGCLKSDEELKAVFESHGVDLDQAMSALCYNGNSASLLSLAAAVCGNESTGVYFGSWTEFGQRAPQETLIVGRGDKSSMKARSV